MGSAVTLREDLSAGQLRELAGRSGDANQTRRLLALSAIYDGGRRAPRPPAAGASSPQVGLARPRRTQGVTSKWVHIPKT
jgi:hypothetical protein